MDTFLVTIEFESTGVDADGNAYVRTGSVDVVEQTAHPRAAEEQARAAFAATSKGAIITVSARAQRPHTLQQGQRGSYTFFHPRQRPS